MADNVQKARREVAEAWRRAWGADGEWQEEALALLREGMAINSGADWTAWRERARRLPGVLDG